MSIFMETTKISAEKTSDEIRFVLVHAGAGQIMSEYKDKKVVALKFTLIVNGHARPYTLPIRIEPVFKLLQKRRTRNRWQFVNTDKEQAERVAWRQVLRWLQSQLAFIETGMADPGEVFLPYMVGEDGRTFWEAITSGSGQLALPPAPDGAP